jgi:hypothetical protein
MIARIKNLQIWSQIVMQNNAAKRASTIIGVIMLVALVGSAFFPLLGNNQATTLPTEAPTAQPQPTFPPPVDVNTLAFDQTYLHPSGLFTVALPTGWTPVQATNDGVHAQVNFNNPNALSVIESYIEVPSTPITTLDELSAHFTPELLGQGWQRYSSWSESTRREEGDKLLIDFSLKLGDQQYIARHVSWTDGEWIYVIRIVAPENAPDSLRALLDKMIPTLHPNKEFADTPTGWNAYFDNTEKHIIRYPSEWTLADSGPGLPASITGNNAILRVDAESGTAADESAAREWVAQTRPGAEVLSVEPVERDGTEGFSVAYSFKDADGEAQSGLAVLLNDANDLLHVANLRLTASQVDLNTDEAKTQYPDLAEVLETFRLMPSLNVAETAAPTPIPS